MKFKKHIADLFNIGDFDEYVEKERLEVVLTLLFERDPEAEVRIHIKGEVYFIQITDMKEDEE